MPRDWPLVNRRHKISGRQRMRGGLGPITGTPYADLGVGATVPLCWRVLAFAAHHSFVIQVVRIVHDTSSYLCGFDATLFRLIALQWSGGADDHAVAGFRPDP